jgi:hypothetical protein
MPGTPTTRLKLPLPAQTDPADVPTDLAKLANGLDPIAVVFTQGLASARPAAGVAGRVYVASDTGAMYWDSGTAWRMMGSPPEVTALPAGPLDGDEVYYQPVASDPSYTWHLRYNANSPNSPKWEFLGGSALQTTPSGSIATSSTSYVALTGGPTITVPNTGAYYVRWAFSTSQGGAGALQASGIPGRGLTALGFQPAFTLGQAQFDGARPFAEQLAAGLTAGDVLQVLVKVNTAIQATFSNGYLSLLPVRIS